MRVIRHNEEDLLALAALLGWLLGAASGSGLRPNDAALIFPRVTLALKSSRSGGAAPP